MSTRITVTVAEKDYWLIDAVNRVVETKKKGGMQSSFSFELVRLAKNGLTGNLAGAEIDQQILLTEDQNVSPVAST